MTVDLPAERGIDPTGIGRVIGLTELGEFKVENDKEFSEAVEFEADAVVEPGGDG